MVSRDMVDLGTLGLSEQDLLVDTTAGRTEKTLQQVERRSSYLDISLVTWEGTRGTVGPI